MRCRRCNAKWNIGNQRPILSLCPICEADYSEYPLLKGYDSIAEFLYELRLDQTDIFGESRRLLAYINDYFPQETAIRDGIKDLYDFGLKDVLRSYLDGKMSEDEFVSFVKANTVEPIGTTIVNIIQFVFVVYSEYGTDYNLPEYYSGVIGEIKDKYQIKALEKAADAGDKESQYRLAVKYKEGIGFQKDLDKAQALLFKASEQGYSEADYLLAELKRELGKNEDEIIDCLRKAANNDNVKAQCRLYYELYKNKGDIDEAINYLKKAASLNYAPAMYEYSLHLLYGDDVEQDVEAAIKYMEAAAAEDEKDAISKLAYIYSVGYLVNKDVKKAKLYKDKLGGLKIDGLVRNQA
ncbi:MAG: sel1 repeat family protein [Lachnospiraceae bacterium]|nr:sel1 repeat family protein [Lachnospiraceae bacterium]